MEEQQTQEQTAEPKGELEEMVQAGVHFGHVTSKTHPKMKPYIAGVRNNVHIIDLEKTVEKLAEALEFLKKLKEEEKTILFVGTKVQVKGPLRELADALGFPFVTERWLGGTLTNFDAIAKQVEAYRELERQKQEGELDKYTKKEQLDMEEDLKRLEVKFGGIKTMTKLPDAVFVADLDENELAVKEAARRGIPVAAIVDTNTNPETVEYPIPANDDALSSVQYILAKVRNALQ